MCVKRQSLDQSSMKDGICLQQENTLTTEAQLNEIQTIAALKKMMPVHTCNNTKQPLWVDLLNMPQFAGSVHAPD